MGLRQFATANSLWSSHCGTTRPGQFITGQLAMGQTQYEKCYPPKNVVQNSLHSVILCEIVPWRIGHGELSHGKLAVARWPWQVGHNELPHSRVVLRLME